MLPVLCKTTEQTLVTKVLQNFYHIPYTSVYDVAEICVYFMIGTII